jgi:hypothetical protein
VSYVNEDTDYQTFESSSHTNDYQPNEDLCDQFQRLLRVTPEARVGRVVNMPPEYTERMLIDNVPIEFTIDTACPVSIISLRCYERNFAHVKLDSSPLKLSSYSKHAVPVKGVFQANVKYGRVQRKLPLYVTEGDDACLLGRQWLEVIGLDWKSIFAVKETPSEIKGLLKEYSDVFSGEQGLIKGFKANVQVQEAAEEGAKPIFWKPRAVPYALSFKFLLTLHHHCGME